MTIDQPVSGRPVGVRVPGVLDQTRCAPWSRACGLRAPGSAVRAPGGVLLVEWPLPWPREVKEITELKPVLAAAEALGVRMLVVSEGRGTAARDHTICFHATPPRDDDCFVSYVPREIRRAQSQVVDGALALLAGAAGEVAAPASDLVICTHGSRDVCCGGAGTALYRAVSTLPLVDVRVWRSSHQGGHRFAPTALVLPHATSWARLDVDLTVGIIEQRVPTAAIAASYRGSSAFADPRVQAIEGVALAEVGWDWLSAARRGVVRENGIVQVAGWDPNGVLLGEFEGVVERDEPRIGPACGGAAGATVEYDAEWIVHAHRRTDEGSQPLTRRDPRSKMAAD